MVRIELFGVPRWKSGRGELDVRAATVGEAMAELDRAHPELELLEHGGLARRYLVAVNGHSFTCDPDLPLGEDDVLVIVSAQAGG